MSEGGRHVAKKEFRIQRYYAYCNQLDWSRGKMLVRRKVASIVGEEMEWKWSYNNL